MESSLKEKGQIFGTMSYANFLPISPDQVSMLVSQDITAMTIAMAHCQGKGGEHVLQEWYQCQEMNDSLEAISGDQRHNRRILLDGLPLDFCLLHLEVRGVLI